VSGGLLAAPLAAQAQPAGKVHRIGFIFMFLPVSEMPSVATARAFFHALRDHGYIEGQNLVVERRSLEGRMERASAVVAELISLKVDLIVSSNGFLTRVAKEATTSIPIVMVAVATPVETGLVASLARPGGNVTGLSWDTGPEVEGKRLELLKDIAPRIARVAWLGSKIAWDEYTAKKQMQAAARVLGVTLFHAESQPPDFGPAFAAITRERADAIFVAASPSNFTYRRTIAEFAAKNRLPAAHPARESVEDGGLISYGPSNIDLYRRAAGYVDKILKGAQPADLPVEQPSKVELVINLKTAKALGLTLPPSLLARADEVIK
jgi:putative ABC transport system substrate-binding protein